MMTETSRHQLNCTMYVSAISIAFHCSQHANIAYATFFADQTFDWNILYASVICGISVLFSQHFWCEYLFCRRFGIRHSFIFDGNWRPKTINNVRVHENIEEAHALRPCKFHLHIYATNELWSPNRFFLFDGEPYKSSRQIQSMSKFPENHFIEFFQIRSNQFHRIAFHFRKNGIVRRTSGQHNHNNHECAALMFG